MDARDPRQLHHPPVHYGGCLSYGSVRGFGDISTPFYALIRALPLQLKLNGWRGTLARRYVGVGRDDLIQG